MTVRGFMLEGCHMTSLKETLSAYFHSMCWPVLFFAAFTPLGEHIGELSICNKYYCSNAHTHTHQFNGHFSGEPPLISVLSIFTGHTKTLHTRSDTSHHWPAGLLWTSHLSSSLCLCRHTSLHPVSIIFTFDLSKPP